METPRNLVGKGLRVLTIIYVIVLAALLFALRQSIGMANDLHELETYVTRSW